MSSDQGSGNRVVQQVILTTRIIVISLVLGVSCFAGFVLLNPPQQAANNRQPLQTWTAIPFALICMVLSAVLPRLIARKQTLAVAAGRSPIVRPAQRSLDPQELASDEGQLAMIYQTTTIIRAALLEGPLFYVWLAYWLEAQPLALALAAVLMLMLIACFPLSGAVERWIADRGREIHEQRELKGGTR